jgi:Protein of unknown function, DUF488
MGGATRRSQASPVGCCASRHVVDRGGVPGVRGVHTSDGFAAAMADLLTTVGTRQVAIMCSETLWWRCHRRLIADVATLVHDIPVDHLMPSGRRDSHEVAVGARLRGDGRVVWDGGATAVSGLPG